MRTVHTAQLYDDLQNVLNHASQLAIDLSDTELGRELSELESAAAGLVQSARGYAPAPKKHGVLVLDTRADTTDPVEMLAIVKQRLARADEFLARATELLSQRRAQIGRIIA